MKLLDPFQLFHSLLIQSLYRLPVSSSGLGGSIALCRPDPKRNIALAITVNRLTFDNSKVTGAIVRAIYKKLDIPVPMAYVSKNIDHTNPHTGKK